jgi:xylulokinase
MQKPFLVSADLGTTGTKAAIFDSAGNLLASAYEETVLHYPKPGWVEQDPQDFYGSAVRTIKTCVEQSGIDPNDVAAISFDGQMAGVCTIDEDWGTPTPYDSWLDSRCKPYIEMMKPHEDLIIQKSGGPPTYCHGPKILWWKHERPEIFAKIHKFVMPTTYVAGRMAGLKGDDAWIDYTHLNFASFCDTVRQEWDQELCDLFDVPMEKLPRIVPPWEVIGTLTPAAARDCGLVAGIPITAGCGDQGAGTLGAGMVEPGVALDVAGTASVFTIATDQYVPDVQNKTLFTAHLVVPDLWYALAYINGGGLNLRWFRDEFVAEEKTQAEVKGDNIYVLLDRAAASVPPGSDRSIFLPHLGGSVCPSNTDIRGTWLGFTWSHTKPHLYRAMLESVAYEYAHYLSIERSLLPHLEFHEVRVIGGGAHSKVWNQIKADVLGIPYVQLNREEYAVMGSAIVAGYAAGVFSDIKATAKAWVRPTNRIEPRPEYHAFYRPLAGLYASLLTETQSVFERLARVPDPPGQ